MKNKKMIAVLVAFSLLQLMFPVGMIAYERSFKKAVIEKGECYSLEFDGVLLFNRDSLTLEKYRVKIGGDYENISNLTHGDSSYFGDLIIEKDEDGVCTVYTADTEGKTATDYNLFRANKAFYLRFEDYEFVREDFGVKELFELCRYLCYDDYGVDSYEEFADVQNYSALHETDLDGRVELSVYKGMAIIKELYIADELILKHK